jgi:hypothetical protein
MPIPLDSKQNFQIIFCLKETECLFQIVCYTMATTLKWPAINGAPKTTGDTPMSSDFEGLNPNDNDAMTFFTIKHYKWLL